MESSGNAVCDEEMIENRKRKVHNGPTDDKRLNYQEEFANDEEESLVDYDEEDHEDDDVALSIDANS